MEKVLRNLAHLNKRSGDEQLLKEHLLNVGRACCDRVPPVVAFGNISNGLVKKLAYFIGAFHDIGKYTTFFQEYLQFDKSSPYKGHAHISALYVFIILQNQLQELEEKERLKILMIVYLCVKYHHQSFDFNMYDLTGQPDEKECQLVQVQWANMLKRKDLIAAELAELYDDGMDFWLEQIENAKKLLKDNRIYYVMNQFALGKSPNSKWYFLLIYLFSLLIDSDKLDSAKIPTNTPVMISPERVEAYLTTKQKGHALVTKRETARASILHTVKALTEEELMNIRFLILTAPTGIGKTLASLQAVLILQKRLANLYQYSPRVITAIPFVNIIEQNKDEYCQVIGDEGRMIIHHRLNDFSKLRPNKGFRDRPNYSISQVEEDRVETKLMEVESWEGDFVLTTFVQLFQSIFTGKNRLLKKFHRLAGSIVVLDEVQAIDEHYMPLVGATLKKLSEYLGTRFVLMTATQPKIIDFGEKLLKKEKIEYKMLLPDYEEYFKALHRTRLIPLLDQKLTQDEFVDLFFEKWQQDQSALVVVNTIKRSIGVYDEIRERLKEMGLEIPVYYLSTNIIPWQRKQVIQEVHDKLSGMPVVLVSTQTIEAGVDLDFQMAFRDLAPLSSIIQTAGRVNREGKKGKYLPVYLVRIAAENGHEDNRMVYEILNQKETEGLVKSPIEIPEENYGTLAEEFYNAALRRGISQQTREVWDHGILNLDFKKVETFRLIDKDNTEDVFVEINEEATRLADLYEKVYLDDCIEEQDLIPLFGKDHKLSGAIKNLDQYGKKAFMKLIKSKMAQYIIQIRVPKLIDNRPPEFSHRHLSKDPEGQKDHRQVFAEMYWIPPGQIEQYYDKITGFKSKTGETFAY
ncbi:CRISPR-associated helicase Cas3' [Alkaliphilus crotonatoxidans]